MIGIEKRKYLRSMYTKNFVKTTIQSEAKTFSQHATFPSRQSCGSGSGRIRNVFLGSGIVISDPDPTNIKVNF